MTTIARPSTPFPHTHSLTHSASGSSYYHLSPRAHYTTPIHFAPKAVPTPTPPSLLARTSSSGSSSSGRIHLRRSSGGHLETPTSPGMPSTPSLAPTSPRRSSCTSLPLTPPLETSPLEMEPAPLALPEPQYKSNGFALPPPEYNWSEKQIEPGTSFDFSFAPPDENVWVASRPTLKRRPVLQRRDTPRPTANSCPLVKPFLKRRDTPRPGQSTAAKLKMITPVDEEQGDAKRRTLRSAIDGGKWIVMEE